MSVQPQPIQQPLGYPYTFTKSPPSSSSSSSPPNSHGSFGTVFIVLAVILVLSVLACVFGRLCNRRLNKQHESHKVEMEKNSRRSVIRPVEREPREPGDLEFGFDQKRVPMGKPMGKPGNENGGDVEFGFDRKRVPSAKHGVKFKLPENGKFRGESGHGGPNSEFKAGP